MNILKKQFAEVLQSNKDFKNKYFDLCFALVKFQEQYPLHFDGVLGNISLEFNSNDENDILYQIYLVGEEINGIIGGFIVEGIKTKVVTETIRLPETIFVFWASVSSLVKIAGQKTAYIQKQMQTSKEEFLYYGFSILFNSIKGETKND